MFPFNKLKQIHLEITTRCQASCPMCSRNIHGGLTNPWLKVSDWSLEDYKLIITEEVINQVDSIYFCGNYGDPVMNKDLIEMCRYTTSIRQDIQIRIHTNGSIQNTKWWQELANVLPADHMVIFGIDGLEDTNHLYRIGTVFDKIMENAAAFIDAGGNAEWAFIVFKHNQHQTSIAEQTANNLGFKVFTKKNSSRYLIDPKFPVYNKNGETTYYLEPPTESKIVFIDKKTIDNYKEVVKNSTIDCLALKNKEIYIDAQGHVYPCCFLGLTPANYYNETSEAAHIRHAILDQHHSMIADFGGLDNLNSKHRPIKDIIDSHEYQTLWKKYWTESKLITCVKTCGLNTISKPKDQFITRETINE